MKYINTLTFAYELSVVDDKMNGYKNSEFNLLKEIDNKWLEFIYSNNIPLSIGYNHFTAKNYLYVCMSFIKLEEEQIKELESIVTAIVKPLDLKTLFPKIEKELSFVESDVVKFVDKVELGNFLPVRFLFSSPEDIKVYERFSKSKIMRKHIDFVCATNGLGKPKSETTYEKLPIHDIEINTTTLLLHSKIVPLFRVFKVANEYLMKNNPDQIEFELGKLMLLDLTFAEYLISMFSTVTEKTNIEKVTQKVLKKANQTIKKNKVPEDYYTLLEEDVKELFGVVEASI
jgi:hypothetical protein